MIKIIFGDTVSHTYLGSSKLPQNLIVPDKKASSGSNFGGNQALGQVKE